MISREALDKIMPVIPLTVNRKINPSAHDIGASWLSLYPNMVANQLNTLIPVGIAITIVAAVKYARVSVSMPTVNMWWAQTINPRKPILIMA